MEIVLQGSISRKNKASGSSCLGFAPLHPHRLLPGILSKSFLMYMLAEKIEYTLPILTSPAPLNEPFVHKNSSTPYYVNPSTLLFPPQDKKVHAQYNCNHPIYTKGVSLTPIRLNYL